MKKLASLFAGKTITNIKKNEYGIGFVFSDGQMVTISEKVMTATVHEYEWKSIKSVTQQGIAYSNSDENFLELVIVDDDYV